MRKVTEEEAKNIRCPFKVATQPNTHFKLCDGKDCMAWSVTEKRVEREDHSGAKQLMYDLSRTRDQELKRKGPPGSLGVWVLEERGTCLRLSTGV